MKSDCGLNFPAGDGVLLVVMRQLGCFRGNPFKDVVDKRVHNAHGLGGDSSVGMNLLQHLVDVDGIGLATRPPSLLLVGV